MGSESEPIALADDSLHVWSWVVDPESGAPSESEVSLLSGEEKARAEHFIPTDVRRLFIRSHVAVRQTLSRYGPIAPQDWIFELGEHGRPEISNIDAPAGLRFNLSHTPGMIALVLNRSFDAGVDVEGIGRVARLESVSRTSFAESEREALLALPPTDQALRFTQIWALKESFIKALGSGLATPLKSFSFDLSDFELSDPASIGFSCEPELNEDPSAWSFTLTKPTDRHVLATAAKCQPQTPILAFGAKCGEA